MKIHELITMLQKYDNDAEVVGTWGGDRKDIDVYESADHLVVIDVYGNLYKSEWQNCRCEICGDVTNGKPRCWQHEEEKQ